MNEKMLNLSFGVHFVVLKFSLIKPFVLYLQHKRKK